MNNNNKEDKDFTDALNNFRKSMIEEVELKSYLQLYAANEMVKKVTKDDVVKNMLSIIEQSLENSSDGKARSLVNKLLPKNNIK